MRGREGKHNFYFFALILVLQNLEKGKLCSTYIGIQRIKKGLNGPNGCEGGKASTISFSLL